MPLFFNGNLLILRARSAGRLSWGVLLTACVAPGTASSPTAALGVLSPGEGSLFVPGQPLVVCTVGHGSAPLSVHSDTDGPVSTLSRTGHRCAEGAQATPIVLSDAVHRLTLSPADGSGVDPAFLTLVPAPNVAPTCSLAVPASGQPIWETEGVFLEAVVSDDGPLRGVSLSVASDLDGDLAQPVARRSGWVGTDLPSLSPGTHTLQLSLHDARGAAGDCSAPLVVLPCTDADGDGVTGCDGDCDDQDGAVAPGVPERENGLDDDCDGAIDEDTAISDDDGDGHTEAEGDCDDTDPAVYPGADDAFYDGVDSDCAGDDDFDADGDGDRSDAHGGTDCDDDDPARYRGAAEVFYDGIDSDCAGDDDFDADGDGDRSDAHGGTDCDDQDTTVFFGATELRDGLDNDCDTHCDEGLLQAGDLVITEIMANPLAVSDSTGEWFEVANTTSTRITLCSGWSGSDDRFDSFTVTTEVVIDPGTPVVFVRNGDPLANGGVVGDYTFGRSFQIAEVDDQITLTFDDPDLGAFEMSRVAFDGEPTWPHSEGATLSLDPAAWTEDDNDDPDSWCPGTSVFGDGDLGTPGAANDGC